MSMGWALPRKAVNRLQNPGGANVNKLTMAYEPSRPKEPVAMVRLDPSTWRRAQRSGLRFLVVTRPKAQSKSWYRW